MIKKLWAGMKAFYGAIVNTTPPEGTVNEVDAARYSFGEDVHVNLPTIPTPFEEHNGTIRFNKAQGQKWLAEAMAPFQTQFGTPYAAGRPFVELAMSTVLFPLMEWNWTTRRYILEQCHNALERMPLVKAAVRYTKLFSVQNGFTCTYKSAAVGEVLDKFIADPRNNVREYDKTFVEALNADGELFIRYFVGGKASGATDAGGGGYETTSYSDDKRSTVGPDDGITGQPGEVVIAPLRPWYVLWIRANPNNFREVIDYRYTGSVSDGSGMDWSTFSIDIPADEIHHVAINRLPYEQRGRPEIFNILPYAQGHKRFLEDRARLNAFKGAVYDVTLQNATPGQVAARAQSYRKPFQAGTVLVHNANETIQTLSADIAAGDASEDGRQIKLMIAAGYGIAEYMLADGSNANLASATAQALPALKTFGEWQDVMRDQVWRPIFRRVLKENIEAGILPEQIQEEKADGTPIVDEKTGEPVMCNTLDAFDVTYTDLETMDAMTAVQALLAAMNGGLMSEKTATAYAPWPLDYDEEQEQIDKENAKAMEDMMSGRVPMPPGIDPATGKPLPPGEGGAPPFGGDGEDAQEEPEEEPAKEEEY